MKKSMNSPISAWKFSLAFLAATISANSTVVWAASEINNKKAFNKYVAENVVMKGLTMDQALRPKLGLLEPASQAAMEAWLNNFGSEKYPSPTIQTSGESNGGKDHSKIKVISTYAGRALTIEIDQNKPDSIVINGQKFTAIEARNLQTVIDRLAKNDSGLKPLAAQLTAAQDLKPTQSYDLSPSDFIRLPTPKKMQYLMLMREMIEAAGEVKYRANHSVSANEQRESSGGSSNFVFLQLLGNSVAWAQSAGGFCLVAGNISVYAQEGKNLRCNPNPNGANSAFQQMGAYNLQCQGPVLDTACNPLIYGFQDDGKPFCLNSKNQPEFTLSATPNCNTLSPLEKVDSNDEAIRAQQQLKRQKQMTKILESYYLHQNPDKKDAIKDCFSDKKSAVYDGCKSLFTDHLEAFEAFRDEALGYCNTTTKKLLPDQISACNAFKERALDLALFGQGNVVTVSGKNACGSGTSWDESQKKCICMFTNGKLEHKDGVYTCTVKVEPVVISGKKDECKKEDGSEKNSFKCNTTLWIGGIALVGIGLWLLGRSGSSVAPASEGGSGTNGGNNGGTRKPTTPPAPTPVPSPAPRPGPRSPETGTQ